MNKIMLVVMLLIPFHDLAGQLGHSRSNHHCHHTKCDTRVEQLDSLVNYRLNDADSSYKPAYVIKYSQNEDGNTLTAERLDLPGRTPVYYQTFEYNVSGKLSSFLNREWKNETWTDTQLTEYLYDENDNLSQEILYRKDASNNWEAYQQHIYSYEGGIIISYTRQVKDTNGNWYDYSHHYYIYDNAGNLTILYGRYINTNEIFWRRTTQFNDKNKPTERVLEILKYDPVVKKNVLKNVNHQNYTYNIYGDVDELFTDEWLNESWKYTNKHIYYYSIIPGKKVSICHNGIHICVSAFAVKAHLEHGDILGACPDRPDDTCRCRCDEDTRYVKPTNGRGERRTKIWPVPFNSEINIDLSNEKTEYSTISLCNANGTIIMSEKINGRESITLNPPNLMSGAYLIRLSGKDNVSVFTVIKK